MHRFITMPPLGQQSTVTSGPGIGLEALPYTLCACAHAEGTRPGLSFMVSPLIFALRFVATVPQLGPPRVAATWRNSTQTTSPPQRKTRTTCLLVSYSAFRGLPRPAPHMLALGSAAWAPWAPVAPAAPGRGSRASLPAALPWPERCARGHLALRPRPSPSDADAEIDGEAV